MRQAGVAASSTLFVGDSRIDFETARNAHVRLLLVSYGMGQTHGQLDFIDSDIVADTPADMGRGIEQFLNGAAGL